MALPTLDDLKAHLDIDLTYTDDDAELTDMLDASIEVVQNIVGPLASGSTTETHYAVTGPTLVTRQVPVGELTAVSVRWYAGMDYTAQDVTTYTVNPDTGEVRLVNGYPWCGDATISYTVGYDTLPTSIKLAVLIIAAQMWETQRGADPLPANSNDDDYAADVRFAPAIPNRAKTLLEPYARGPVVA